MKKTKFLLMLVCVFALGFSTVYAGNNISFKDIEQAPWAKDYIYTLVENEGIKGYTDGTFKPQKSLSWGEFLSMTTRLICLEDIPQNEAGKHWAYPNLVAAVEKGILDEKYLTTVQLDQSITREEMAYVCVSAAVVNGENLNTLDGIEKNIKDCANINSSYREYVLKAYSNGLLLGDNNGNFNPKKALTRAESTVVLCKLLNFAERPDVIVKEASNVEVLNTAFENMFNLKSMSYDVSIDTEIEVMGMTMPVKLSAVSDNFMSPEKSRMTTTVDLGMAGSTKEYQYKFCKGEKLVTYTGKEQGDQIEWEGYMEDAKTSLGENEEIRVNLHLKNPENIIVLGQEKVNGSMATAYKWNISDEDTMEYKLCSNGTTLYTYEEYVSAMFAGLDEDTVTIYIDNATGMLVKLESDVTNMLRDSLEAAMNGVDVTVAKNTLMSVEFYNFNNVKDFTIPNILLD